MEHVSDKFYCMSINLEPMIISYKGILLMDGNPLKGNLKIYITNKPLNSKQAKDVFHLEKYATSIIKLPHEYYGQFKYWMLKNKWKDSRL